METKRLTPRDIVPPRLHGAMLAMLLALACRSPRPYPWETYGIADLRAIAAALEEYRAACGEYPASLDRLGPPPDGAGSKASRTCAHYDNLVTRLIDRTHAWPKAVPSQKYALLYKPSGRTGDGFTEYEIEAWWVAEDAPSYRSFWASGPDVITIAPGRRATRFDERLR